MNEQEKMEQILKEIHVMISKCDHYNDDENLVILDKQKLFSMLEKINLTMYDMMDSYEVTQAAKARGARKVKEQGESILKNAEDMAEDVYAASILYMDEVLLHLRQQSKDMMKDLEEAYTKAREEFIKEDRKIVSNRMELRQQLQEMRESDKYIYLIDEENRRRRENPMPKGGYVRKEIRPDLSDLEDIWEEEPIRISAPTPQIYVDPAYAEDTMLDAMAEESGVIGGPEIRVNMDSAYFKQKQNAWEDIDEGVVGGNYPGAEEDNLKNTGLNAEEGNDADEQKARENVANVRAASKKFMEAFFGKKTDASEKDEEE